MWMAFGVLMSLISAIAGVTLMAVAGWFVTTMSIAGAGAIAAQYSGAVVIIRLSAFIRTIGRYAERLVTHEATFRLIARLRVWFYGRLDRLPHTRLMSYRSGDMMSRLRSDIDCLDKFYIGFFIPVITALLLGVMLCVALAFYSTLMAALLGAVMLVGIILIPLMLLRFTSGLQPVIEGNMTHLQTELATSLQGMGELLIYDLTGQQRAHMLRISRDMCNAKLRLSHMQLAAQHMISFLGHVTMLAFLIIAVKLVMAGSMTPPAVALLVFFTLALFEALAPLPEAFTSLGKINIAAARIFDIADHDGEHEHEHAAAPISDFDIIEFEDVRFAYDEAPVLDGVSFTINKAQHLAITGPTGSGKSTLVELLLGHIRPNAGRISIDGKDASTLCQEQLAGLFAVVPQRPHIFAATIRQNLLIANKNADMLAMREVCEQVGLLDFIDLQPDGFDTYVGENGMSLSGGQIKRLAVARALLKDSPALLLDEPTEGLDYTGAKALLKSIDRLAADKSIIVITHNPSHLREMSDITLHKLGHISG